MRKQIGIFPFCILMCICLVSCQGNDQVEQEAYHYIRDTLYTADATNSVDIRRFHYNEKTLYGIKREYTENYELYNIIKFDMSSGDQIALLDATDAERLGKLQDFIFDEDNHMWILSSNETQFYLTKVIDGKIEQQTVIDYIPDREIYWTDPMIFVDNRGQIYSSLNLDNIYVINEEGIIITTISTENCIVKSFFEMDNEVYVTYSDESGVCIAKVNMETGKIEMPVTVLEHAALSDICPAELLNMKYCYYDTNGVNSVDKEGNKTQLFSWTEHGWGESYPDRLFVTEEGDILCCRWDEIVKMKRVSAQEGDQRQRLTLAAFDAGEALKYLVADFNKTSETHLISIVDYNLYNTDTDKYAGLTKLNTEIIGGNPPDMIDLRNIDARQYMEMGVLEDLYPYIESDPEIDRENYLPNVLNAMGDGEALYGVTTTFRVNTVAAKTFVVNSNKWNLQGLQEMVAANPQTYLGVTKTSLLELACDYMQDHFVDWEENLVKFNSPEFFSLLAACSTLPEETEVREIYEIYFKDPDYPAFYATSFVSSFTDALEYEEIWGEPISYIGFPESGSTISLRMHVGMLSGGEHKDAVWSFLRTALLPKAQMENAEFIMGFPISENSFEQAVQQTLDPNSDIGIMIDGSTGESMEIIHPTEEQVSKVAELARSTDKLASTNTVIKDIVLEEAAPYFAGSKTAAETAAVIQNRVTTYMGEQMK